MLPSRTGYGRGAARPAPAVRPPLRSGGLAAPRGRENVRRAGTRRPRPSPRLGPSARPNDSELALGLPEDLRDLVDLVQELLALRGVVRLLGRPGLLGCVPEEVVQVRVLLEVLGLEIVGPQHPQVLLDQVRSLFLDDDGALAEHIVVGALVLLLTRLHGLGLDARLRRVVDAARQIAMPVDRAPRCKDAAQHGSN